MKYGELLETKNPEKALQSDEISYQQNNNNKIFPKYFVVVLSQQTCECFEV